MRRSTIHDPSAILSLSAAILSLSAAILNLSAAILNLSEASRVVPSFLAPVGSPGATPEGPCAKVGQREVT
jgi:hypothetical protein